MKISSAVSGLARILAVVVAIGGLCVLAILAAPSVSGQRADGSARADRGVRELTVLAGRGAEIGVSIRDVEASEKTAGGPSAGGVIVEDVRPDSPAEKAGLKRSDVIVEFDGERVRSARQFSRLVQETPSGRTVKATILRDGQKHDLQISPSEEREGVIFDEGRLRERLGEFNRFYDRMPPFNFNFDMGTQGWLDSRGRLGVSVQELTPQLASYFGAKEGVLIAAVTDGSAAAKAGLKAGDVVVAVNGERVHSRDDLVRSLGEVKDGGEVTIGIVRDKRESTLTVKLESRRPPRSGRPA